MSHYKFYPEDVLVAKFQSGEYGWLDFVNHHSKQWQEEFIKYCKDNNLSINDENAEKFVHYKDEQLEQAMEEGNA